MQDMYTLAPNCPDSLLKCRSQNMYFMKDMLEVVTVVDANHFNVSTCLPKAAEAGSPLEGFGLRLP